MSRPLAIEGIGAGPPGLDGATAPRAEGAKAK